MKALFNCDPANITDSVRSVLKENSPLTYVKPGLPPFLIVQGSADKTVPAERSRRAISRKCAQIGWQDVDLQKSDYDSRRAKHRIARAGRFSIPIGKRN